MDELTDVKKSSNMRSDRMIEWILRHKERIDSYSGGNVEFSFKGDSLKIKLEIFDKA